MNDGMLGQVKALLEITARQSEENQRLLADIQEIANSMKIASREIDDLRGLIGDIEKLVKKHNVTDWVTTGGLAKRLGVTPRTVQIWFKKGVIPGHRISETSHIRYSVEEVNNALRTAGKLNKKDQYFPTR